MNLTKKAYSRRQWLGENLNNYCKLIQLGVANRIVIVESKSVSKFDRRFCYKIDLFLSKFDLIRLKDRKVRLKDQKVQLKD